MSKVFMYIFSVISGVGFIGMIPLDSDPDWFTKTCICFMIFVGGAISAYVCSKWSVVCRHIFATKYMVLMFFHMIILRKSKFAVASRKLLVKCGSVSECYNIMYQMYDKRLVNREA